MEQNHQVSLSLKSVFRPQSAHVKLNNNEPASSFIQTGQTEGNVVRPWTAHPKSRSEVSPRKLPRQNLRKSHLRAPLREVSRSDEHVDAVSDVYNLNRNSSTTLVSSHSDTAVEESEIPAASSKSLSPKSHPSFENWVAGSPHDSDEYDTDIEDEKLTEKKILQSQLQPDPTGLLTYEENCKKNACVPISYLRRHLGKRNIRMRHHYLGGQATKPIAEALKRNTVTENLDIGDNCLEAEGAYHIAKMLKDNTFIVSMNVSNNYIRSTGAASFARMLEVNTTLKTLSLAGNQLSDKDAYHFIEALKNNMSLMSLDLSQNDFGERGGEMIGAALSVNDGLADLDLSWNSIRNKGAVAIAKALKVNGTLEVLDLSWNGFGPQGAEGLQQALQVNTSLRVLDLTNNRINTKAAHKLANGLRKNFGLETLVLNQNPLCDEGIEVILKAASVNETLKFLSMEELSINAANFRLIKNLEDEKKMVILHGGVGGYQRTSTMASVLRLFVVFTREHHSHLENVFTQQDKDKTGVLTADEMKYCLKEAGLRLTSKQLELLLSEIDFSHTGNIKYRDVLSGQAFSEYHNNRPSRGFRLVSKDDSPVTFSSVTRQLTVV